MRSVPAPSSIRLSGVGAQDRRRRDELEEALLLEQAGSGSWRVCDGRIAVGHGRFLAFVEERNGGFEVMQMADDFIWSAFPTMRAALTHVVATSPAVLLARPTGDLAWLK